MPEEQDLERRIMQRENIIEDSPKGKVERVKSAAEIAAETERQLRNERISNKFSNGILYMVAGYLILQGILFGAVAYTSRYKWVRDFNEEIFENRKIFSRGEEMFIFLGYWGAYKIFNEKYFEAERKTP